MNQEVLLFICSLWTGVQLAACYDLLRIFRRIIRHGDFWIGVEDLLYWCFCGVFLFARMYQENDGIIRFYALGGAAVGAAMYHYSLSRILVTYITLALKKIIWILRIPFAWLARGTKRLKFKGNRVKLLLNNHLSKMKVRMAEYGESKHQEKKSKKKKKEKSAE